MSTYRFGLTDEMTEDEVREIVKKHTKERREKFMKMKVEDRETLAANMTEIFFIDGNVITFSEQNPLEAIIETYVEEKYPELTRELDREGKRDFMADYLPRVTITEKHLILDNFFYEYKPNERASYITGGSTLFYYVTKHAITKLPKITKKVEEECLPQKYMRQMLRR